MIISLSLILSSQAGVTRPKTNEEAWCFSFINNDALWGQVVGKENVFVLNQEDIHSLCLVGQQSEATHLQSIIMVISFV